MTPLLQRPAVAIDLPGRGTHPAPLEEVTVDLWADVVAEHVRSVEHGGVVLVGHSLAGVVLPRVAERVPDRLARMVFVASAVPAEGQSVIESLGGDLGARAQASGHFAVVPAPPEDFAREMFCNDMNEEQARFVLDRLVPEAMSPMRAANRLAGLERGVPCTYVKLLSDATLSPELQDQMISHLGGADVVELDAGHDAMVSRPEALAAVLNALD